MGYRIVGDSCTDLTPEMKQDPHFRLVPLHLMVDDVEIVDDDTFDQARFISLMRASSSCPKSACPAPVEYMKHFEGGDDIYVITLSGRLSGSYNSAVLAKNIYEEENGARNICVVDSRSASCGQMLIAKKIQELCEAGLPFEQVSALTLKYRDEMNTKFVLESLDNLRKNGRLSNIKAFLAEALNIKPVMTGTAEGDINNMISLRGMKKSLKAMAEFVAKDAVDPANRTVGIAHCNNPGRALEFKGYLEQVVHFKDCIIVETRGVSTLYANDGGIICSY